MLPALVLAADAPDPSVVAVAYEQTIRPLLGTYCHRCHGGEKTKGNHRDLLLALSARMGCSLERIGDSTQVLPDLSG